MDAGHILVAVLTSAAAGWLIWVEVHCRHNMAAQKAKGCSSAAELKSVETHIMPSRPTERASKPNVRITQR